MAEDDARVGGHHCNQLCRWWIASAKPEAVDRAMLPFGGSPAQDLRRLAPDEPPTSSADRRPAATPRRRLVHRRMRSGVAAAERTPGSLQREAARTGPLRAIPTTPSLTGRGGFPGGIEVADPGPMMAEAPPGEDPAAARPAWEQAALRVFESLNDPVAAAPQVPGGRRHRSRKYR